MKPRNLLATRNGRFLTFGILYISEGIPYGFTSIAMVAFMRQQAVSLELIGTFVAAMFLPWAFKWAWAPLIDLIKLDKLGGRKAWIVFCTVMMILTLVVTAMVDFKENFGLLLAMIVLNNLFCATQDVAIDSLAVRNLKVNERAGPTASCLPVSTSASCWAEEGPWLFPAILGLKLRSGYISALLLINLMFVLFFVRDPQADPDARQDHVIRRLVTSMTAFVKEVYASFWQSGRDPCWAWPLHYFRWARWLWHTRCCRPSRSIMAWTQTRLRDCRFITPWHQPWAA